MPAWARRMAREKRQAGALLIQQCRMLHGIQMTIQLSLNAHYMHMQGTMENRTARMTFLIDPKKKQLFEEICAQQDLTSSQVVRRLIHQYILEHAGSRELPEWLTAPVGNKSQ